jgi:chromosome segregation ATPase
MVDVVVENIGTDSLCGFSHCRAPLPAPGPRGGRPFAYCPERTWTGGKTCKQLAGAQDALAEALGTPADAGITAATRAFTAVAGELAEPLGEVLAIATALRDSLAAELDSAAVRIAEAEETAIRERGLRRQAEEATTEAVTETQRTRDEAAEVVRTATAEADRCRAERDRAVVTAAASAEARAQAELAQARAEGMATTERERAEQTVREERSRTEAAEKAMATTSERLATARAERDAARTALEDLRAAATEHQRVAEAATTELTRARTRETDLIAELTTTKIELTSTRTELSDANAELTQAQADATTAKTEATRLASEATTKIAAAEHDLTRLRMTTAALRDVLLTPDLETADLRTRLLAELLDRTS